MWATVESIAGYVEELAPLDLALPDDPVGLQLGDPGAAVKKVMVALELDDAVLRRAVDEAASLVVTHHPLFFRPVQSVDESDPSGALAAAAIRNNISVYSAHTNLDTAPLGLNYYLANLLGLSGEKRRVIKITGMDRYLKLAVFIPRGHEDTVRDALAEAGAGWIGNYSHCAFMSPGTGTFMPLAGTEPFIGRQGRLEKVDEMRLETIVPASRRRKVPEALKRAHPYEEVAFDLYPLIDAGVPAGLGLAGTLEEPLPLEKFLKRCRERLGLKTLRYRAPDGEFFSRVAVCGGSGGSLVAAAAGLGAELFVSGDFKYHDYKAALAAGIGLIDVGHYGSEQPVVDLLAGHLRACLGRDGIKTAVVAGEAAAEDWSYL